MGRGGRRKIDFSAYRKAVIDVAKFHKGQTLNKDEMFDFWYLVERAYRHHVEMPHVFLTRQFNHNALAIPLLKKRSMVTVEPVSTNKSGQGSLYTFGDTHE